MREIPIPGTDAVLEVDEEALAEQPAPPVTFNDLPDLHPHSGETFGKPKLEGA